MTIKHMPFGLHLKDDCGFQRKPIYPMAGECVSIEARIEKPIQDLRLEWQLNGQEQTSLAATMMSCPGNDMQYAPFILSTPADPASVTYRICAHREATVQRTFDTLSEAVICDNDIIALGDDFAVMKSGIVYIAFVWENTSLRVFGGKEAATEILAKYSSTMTQNPHSFSLCMVKRFTVHGVNLLIPITVNCDVKGNIFNLSMNLNFVGHHIYGLGERFDKVDQQGADIDLRVEEYFGVQANHSYLPVPVFMTEAGEGLFCENLRTVHAKFERCLSGTQVYFRQSAAKSGLLFTLHFLKGSPAEMIRQYQMLTGIPALPPQWALGIWNCNDMKSVIKHFREEMS